MRKHYLMISFAIFVAVVICINPYHLSAAPKMIEIGDENMLIIARTQGSKDKPPVVSIIIADPMGRKKGIDTRTRTWINEFDASLDPGFEWNEKEQKYECVPSYLSDIGGIDEEEYKRCLATPGCNPEYLSTMGDDSFYVCDTEVELNLMPGDYTVEAIGTGLTDYEIIFVITRRIKGQPTKSSMIEFNGVIDKNLTSKFKITYNPDPSKKPGVGVRIAIPSSLKQDITLSRKLNWIDNDGIMKSLLSKADAIEASIAKGNKTAAKNQLNAFINEVNAQKGKHISDKAVKILLEDAQYLLGNL